MDVGLGLKNDRHHFDVIVPDIGIFD